MRETSMLADEKPGTDPITPVAPPSTGAAAILAELCAGRLSAAEHAEACLRRIAQRDDEIKAWSHVAPEQVMAEAERLDRVPPGERGPLHGLAVGVKDVILTADMPTRYNSPGHAGRAAGIDAACVAILRAQPPIRTLSCRNHPDSLFHQG